MDRRQKKTRDAIFEAFIKLLSKKNFDHITVSEIIEEANIGRATFYAHFETKDFLLSELCGELFDHVFESAAGDSRAHTHIFDCDAPESVFLHLLFHLKKNDNHILDLLSGKNNELFIRCFKAELVKLVESQITLFEERKAEELPMDFFVNHIVCTFVGTLEWWISNKLKQTPEQIAGYFLLAV